MAFSLASLFGLKTHDTTPKTLVVLKHRCPKPSLPSCFGMSGRSVEPEGTESAHRRPRAMHQLWKMHPLLLPQGIGDGESMNRKGLLPNLFYITLAYFALGIISILFANLALLCMALPFILLAKTKKKLWCQTYCPRASLLNAAGRKKKWRKNPAFITNGRLRSIMLWYFGLNLLFITGSTVQVALGRMEAMPYIRLFIAIELFSLPQLLAVQAPLFLIHLSYRFYGMMASTTLLALVLSRIYRPRIWCAVCPIGTLSDSALRLGRKT
jgi:hypothetical protein